MNSNWNTLVTPANGYDNSRDIYNFETFASPCPLRMPDEGYDTDRDIYNAETFGSITKRKKPASFDAPPGLNSNKRFKSVNEVIQLEQETRIRNIVRDEIYQAARLAVGAVRPITSLSLAKPMDTNPSYMTPRPSRQAVATWAPEKRRIPIVRQTNEYVPPVYGPQTYEQYINSLIYNFDALQGDN